MTQVAENESFLVGTKRHFSENKKQLAEQMVGIMEHLFRLYFIFKGFRGVWLLSFRISSNGYFALVQRAIALFTHYIVGLFVTNQV